MTQAPRAGHHVACPRTGTIQQQQEQQNVGLRPPYSMSIKHTHTQHACIRTHAHVHTHTCTCIRMHTHARAHTHTHARTSVHMSAHTRKRTHAQSCTHTNTYTHTHIWRPPLMGQGDFERVGTASLRPKFEWPQSSRREGFKVRRTLKSSSNSDQTPNGTFQIR